MQDHDRVRPRRALTLAPAGVVLGLAPSIAAQDEDVLSGQHGRSAVERVLGRLRQLALLDLRRDREGDEAEQQPAHHDDQDPAEPGPLAAHQAGQPASPAALRGRGPQAREARLADPIAQAGPRAVDPVWRLLPTVGGLLALGSGPFLARPAAPAVDLVLGLLAASGLAGAPGVAGLIGFFRLPATPGAPGPPRRPIISLRRHGISILTHAAAGPFPPLRLAKRSASTSGGTKMLVGVVDSEQQIHYEGTESSIGLSEDRLVEDLAAELQEAKAARPNVRAAGLGIPATIDRRARCGHPCRQPRHHRRSGTRRDAGAARPTGVHRQRRERRSPGRVPLRRGPRRSERGVAHGRHRHRRGADPQRRGVPRVDRGGGGARTHRDRGGWPALPGQLPQPWLCGVACVRAPRSPRPGRRPPSATPTRRWARRSPMARS